jgi:hypothetical protein
MRSSDRKDHQSRRLLLKGAVGSALSAAAAPFVTTASSAQSYGPSLAAMGRRSAHFVDRILMGSHPADLPIEQPYRIEPAILSRPPGRWDLFCQAVSLPGPTRSLKSDGVYVGCPGILRACDIGQVRGREKRTMLRRIALGRRGYCSPSQEA